MSKHLLRICGVARVAVIALHIASPAIAQNNDQTANLRGTVVSYSDSTLKVKSRQGALVDVQLADGWKIASLARASVESIKPGDYVGIASLPKGSGDQALEVLIFPPAMKGQGEGSHDWDLKPHSSMTNASVSNLVKGVEGQTVTLSYGNQQKTLTIPSGAPVVTLAPATPDDLKPGAAVFIPKAGAGDKVTAHQVLVGKDGIVPPM